MRLLKKCLTCILCLTLLMQGAAYAFTYENGTVNLFCGWGSAINIDDVQCIVLGDLVLWEAK